MRILAWNLLHGGGKRIPGLADAIIAHMDMCVLSESRIGPDARLIELLASHGLVYHASTRMPRGKNGVLVVSRSEVIPRPPPSGAIYQQRWLELALPEHGFQLVACHMPPKISIGVEQRSAFWSTLLEYAAHSVDRPAMIIGDLN